MVEGIGAGGIVPYLTVDKRRIREGQISLKGDHVTGCAASDRGVSMVFAVD